MRGLNEVYVDAFDNCKITCLCRLKISRFPLTNRTQYKTINVLLRINFSTSFPQKSHLSNVPFFNGLNAYYKTQLCSHEYTINTPFHAFRIVASTNSSSKNLIQFLISDNISINLLKTKIYISIFFQRQPTRNFKRNYTDSILPIYSYN